MTDTKQLVAEEAAFAEEHASDDYPAGTEFTRDDRTRSKVLQVRVTPEEFTAIARLADGRGIPISTMARAFLLDALGRESPEAAEYRAVLDEAVTKLMRIGKLAGSSGKVKKTARKKPDVAA